MKIERRPTSTIGDRNKRYLYVDDDGDIYLIAYFEGRWYTPGLSESFWVLPTPDFHAAVDGLTPYQGSVTLSND